MRRIAVLRKLTFGLFVTVMITSWSAVQAEKLTTIVVKSEQFKQYTHLEGIVEAIQQATLFAQTSGRVIKLNYDVDDFVKKGNVIARLRNTEQKARFKQAQAGLDAAKAQSKEAELEFARVSDLYKKKLVSASLKDKADAGLKSAKAQLNAAKARADEASEQLDHTVIRAPFSGTVTKRHIEVGETLQAGQAIISGVAKQDALRFNVQIPQRLIEKARKLSDVDIVLDNGRYITANQITIFPTADTKTHSFQLRAQAFTNLHRLYPGMFVKVAIETGVANEIVVPVSSVVHRSELNAVYVLTADNIIQFRAVRIGQTRADQQIILAGLKEGDVVITDPNKAAIAIKTQLQGE